MHLLSVNVGLPRAIEWAGRTVTTGIFKQSVDGPLELDFLNFAGDRQADLTVHGGPDKAVYAYDMAHYAHWREQLDREDWAPGLFGENLTTEGLLESAVRVGDLFRIGTAVLRAVQPRFPCFKLNIRFNDSAMAGLFSRAGRPGIYFRVVEAGLVQAGDTLQLLEAAATDVTIQSIFHLVLGRQVDESLRAAAVALPHLPASLKRQLGA